MSPDSSSIKMGILYGYIPLGDKDIKAVALPSLIFKFLIIDQILARVEI